MEFKRKRGLYIVQTYEAKNAWNRFWGIGTLKSREQPTLTGGRIIDYYEDGKDGLIRVGRETKNKAGKLHGRVWTRSITGDLEEFIYDDGKKNGHYKGCFLTEEERCVERTGQYRNDRKTGIWLDRLQGDGTLLSESHYDPQSLLGFRLSYDANRKPQQFTALFDDYEITLRENGLTISHPDSGKEKAPVDGAQAFNQMNSAYEVHRLAVSFMEKTMTDEWGKIGKRFDEGMQDVLQTEMENVRDCEEKLQKARTAFDAEKINLMEKQATDKKRIGDVLAFMGKSSLVLDA